MKQSIAIEKFVAGEKKHNDMLADMSKKVDAMLVTQGLHVEVEEYEQT